MEWLTDERVAALIFHEPTKNKEWVLNRHQSLLEQVKCNKASSLAGAQADYSRHKEGSKTEPGWGSISGWGNRTSATERKVEKGRQEKHYPNKKKLFQS